MKKGSKVPSREAALLRLIGIHQPIWLAKLHTIIAKDKALRLECGIEDEANYGKTVLSLMGKKVINNSVNSLLRKKQIKSHQDDDSLTSYSLLTEEEKANLPSVKKKEKEEYIIWTDPQYVEKNKRWEFYKKNQDDEVIDIYHSEDEEELRTQHKQKVMSHIMAAMTNPDQEAEVIEQPKRTGINTKGTEGKKKKDSSAFLANEAKFTIMRMRLEGYPYVEIIDTVSQAYSLSVMSVSLYFSDVLKEIREKSQGVVEQTIQDHLERYEQLFKWFKENGYSRAALKALERKEKLIGLHGQEDVVGGVLKGLMGEGKGKGHYNWEQLSPSQRKRVRELALKTVIIIDTENKSESPKVKKGK